MERRVLNEVSEQAGWKYVQVFLWILNMHNTNTYIQTDKLAHIHRYRNEREGEWLATVSYWTMERQMKYSQNTPTIFRSEHSLTHTHTHTITDKIIYTRTRTQTHSQSVSAGVAAAVAHKSQCKHTMNITIFSMLPIVLSLQCAALWCFVSLNTDLRLMRAHNRHHVVLSLFIAPFDFSCRFGFWYKHTHTNIHTYIDTYTLHMQSLFPSVCISLLLLHTSYTWSW